MEETIQGLHQMVEQLQGQLVNIIYHPHSSYRLIKQGNARIGQCYQHFFEVEITTKEYGCYPTTITYLDLYTESCKIIPCEDEIDETAQPK